DPKEKAKGVRLCPSASPPVSDCPRSSASAQSSRAAGPSRPNSSPCPSSSPSAGTLAAAILRLQILRLQTQPPPERPAPSLHQLRPAKAMFYQKAKSCQIPFFFGGGIDVRMDETEITSFFARYGYGFVSFYNDMDVQKIVESQINFHGKKLKLGPAIRKQTLSAYHVQPRPLVFNPPPPPQFQCNPNTGLLTTTVMKLIQELKFCQVNAQFMKLLHPLEMAHKRNLWAEAYRRWNRVYLIQRTD
ncbi:hypothetical protein E2I00_004884, partial [Balaenoptera physalus]